MRRKINLLAMLFVLMLTTTSCLYSGLEDIQNSTSKELSAINYTYRFLYNDTIKKGTPNQEIQIGRVCEVVFKQQSEKITEGGLTGFKTTLNYDINSIQKAGPTGSVTKAMLFQDFVKLIEKEGISRLWMYASISDASSLTPLNGAPKLGVPGDFTKDHTYRVTAADGSTQDYIVKTVKGF